MTDNKYVCTVLMISYNHREYIKKAIDSVLEQETTYKFIVKIFDDCSTDGTIEIISEYVNKYNNIEAHFSERNLGAQGNIWRAYKSVKTKYCILLECDDYWCDKKKIQMQIRALERNNECSFCGHNTVLRTSNEKAREYEEGSFFCTNPILKKKKIFEYEDFRYDTKGGYIPLLSSRLIRMDLIDMESIKYKESFLFDHTQFYYLLLRGKYYYIDRVMSVYRRTGEGTASSKPPLVFLNTFLQNSIDFNKETNYVIADKIFLDCRLQLDFRLFLNKRYEYDKLLEYVKNDCINICSPVALGDTFIWAGLKDAIEKEFGYEVHYIIKPQYKVVMDMFEIDNYTIFSGFDLIDWDSINRESIPKKGSLFLAHPVFYIEYRKMYEALHEKQISTDFLTFFKHFIGLGNTAKFVLPSKCPELSPLARERIGSIPLDKIVVFSVEANSVDNYDASFWEKKARKMKEQGFCVFINTTKNFKCKCAKTISLSITDAIALSAKCHAVYAVRSGFCDLLFPFVKELHIYYPTHSDRYIFGIDQMYGINDERIIEKIRIKIKKTDEREYALAKTCKRPYLFGTVLIPEAFHMFYNNHPNMFMGKKIIKYLTKWK